ncbi:MAG TPA: hypothetical protein VM260_25495 [Pirellula sp.]|nr:hypothetical protein [Pirellula sp.]
MEQLIASLSLNSGTTYPNGVQVNQADRGQRNIETADGPHEAIAQMVDKRLAELDWDLDDPNYQSRTFMP